MKSIAIVDKYPIIRNGLRLFLNENFESTTVIESENLSQYLAANVSEIADVVIIGNTLELFSSICESITYIKKICYSSQVIVFDESPDHIKIVRSFKAGAKGYLTKFSDMQELHKCISKACEGRIYICHDALGLILPDYRGTEQSSKEHRQKLSSREYDVANLLLSGESISMIGTRMDLKVTTVGAIKRKIFKKLNITRVIDLKKALKNHLDSQNQTRP
jgi:DNA-binding NarL/FixJ family response regulator